MKPESSIFLTRLLTVFSSSPSLLPISLGPRLASDSPATLSSLNASSQNILSSFASMKGGSPLNDLSPAASFEFPSLLSICRFRAQGSRPGHIPRSTFTPYDNKNAERAERSERGPVDGHHRGGKKHPLLGSVQVPLFQQLGGRGPISNINQVLLRGRGRRHLQEGDLRP